MFLFSQESTFWEGHKSHFVLCDLGHSKSLPAANTAEESHSEQGSDLVQIFMHTSYFNEPFSVLQAYNSPGLDFKDFTSDSRPFITS